MLSPALPKRATALLLKGLESGTPAQAASNNAYPIFLTKIFVKGFCVQLFMIRYIDSRHVWIPDPGFVRSIRTYSVHPLCARCIAALARDTTP